MIAGTLEVQMLANLTRLSADMNKAKSIVSGTARHIESAMSAAKVALAGLGAGLSVAALTAAFQETVKLRSALDDLADTTGDNVTTLDALRRQAHVSGAQFESVSSAAVRLARNLNNADEEGQAAAEAIKVIGLEVETLRAMKPADAMLEVAKALDKFEDGAGKVAVAVALMGKEGAKMLPFLKDLVNDGDAVGKVTAEQMAQAEKLEKEWRRLILMFKEGKETLATLLIPELSNLITMMQEAIRTSGLLGGALRLFEATGAMGTPAERIASSRKNIEDLNEGIRIMAGLKGYEAAIAKAQADIIAQEGRLDFAKFQQRLQALRLAGPGSLDARDLKALQKDILDPGKLGGKPKAGSTADPFGDLMKKLKLEQAGLESQKSTFMEVSVMLREDKKLRDGLTQAQKELVLQEAARVDVLKDVKRQQDEVNQATEQAAKASADLEEAQEKMADHYRDLIDPMRKYERELQAIAVLQNRNKLTEEEAALAREIVQQRQFEEANKNVAKETEKLDEAWKELGLTFSSAFEDAIVEGKKLSDVLKGLEQDIARILTRKLVTEPLANSLSSAVKGAGGSGGFLSGIFDFFSGGGGIGYGAAGTAAGTAMVSNGVGGFVPALAGGTDYVPNDMFAYLHKGERVVPADENNDWGGGDVIINAPIDARGADAGAVQRIEMAVEKLRRSIIPIVMDGKRRNAFGPHIR